MLKISGIFIYPIKSLGGISLTEANTTDRGLQYDRRWMLVDEAGVFLTQRSHPAMALLQVQLQEDGLYVFHKHHPGQNILIPFEPESSQVTEVEIWDDHCSALVVSETAGQWFSGQLGIPCRLVLMPEATRREVDQQYAFNGEITSFADAYPVMMIGQASLDDLNSKLDVPVPMNRFRPNIVFSGGKPFREDEMKSFQINGITFSAVKPCARCVLTTINQETAEKGKDPLATLAAYRKSGNKILFGQNLLLQGQGKIRVGDDIIPV
ncbi:MOSC domain-containing protein [Flavihumibacter stibioxidans]|uniref:Oxidoreductase n=1 Tax=Flavihumibacter stibioxidans TaxID=1834163 RepID=A0ABR7MD25_9BACT|nr:MOSC N-terminal beta barrel domain-containing protein [Flavihumibacter stibioxidans]MBC6492934.1 oxidoreductase [Flavihumibacter stibioxidans]